MAIQERNFKEIFGEHPDPTHEVSRQTLKATLFGAAIMLQADCSEANLVDAVTYFAAEPRDYIHQASNALHGEIEMNDSLNGNSSVRLSLEQPLTIVSEIIDRIDRSYDWETNKLQETFDPRAITEEIVDDMLLNEKDSVWQEKVKILQEETDTVKKVALARAIKEEIIENAVNGLVVFRGNQQRKVIPKWENIVGSHAVIDLVYSTGSLSSMDLAVGDVDRAIKKQELKTVLESLPKIDTELFNALRLTFGAKGANLILLQDVQRRLEERLVENNNGYSLIPEWQVLDIPEFVGVPVDLYNKWSSGQSIDEDLLPYFEWTKTQIIDGNGIYEDELADYIVRSSAVHSEDGEKLSGAGIYKSVTVEEEDTGKFEAFKNAVTQVFESTNSASARSYREQNGVTHEEMGLVIQRLVPEKYEYGRQRKHSVTINSVMPGISGLIEINDKGQRQFVKRAVVDENLSYLINNALTFNPDHEKYHDSLHETQVIKYAVASFLLELVWGGPIQMECVGDNLVQIRRVFDAYDGEVLSFPEEPEIARGNGVGVGDKTLKVLPSMVDNSQKRGLVQIRTNWLWSVEGNTSRLPEEGAVVIKQNGDGNGHLQTLCVERGLLCMYPEDGFRKQIPDLAYGSTVRIVSNGIEARMYEVSDEESPLLSPDELD